MGIESLCDRKSRNEIAAMRNVGGCQLFLVIELDVHFVSHPAVANKLGWLGSSLSQQFPANKKVA